MHLNEQMPDNWECACIFGHIKCLTTTQRSINICIERKHTDQMCSITLFHLLSLGVYWIIVGLFKLTNTHTTQSLMK